MAVLKSLFLVPCCALIGCFALFLLDSGQAELSEPVRKASVGKSITRKKKKRRNSEKEPPESPFFPRQISLRQEIDVAEFYDVKEKVGEGKFGQVFRCSDKLTGKDYAGKFIDTYRQQQRESVEHEINILSKLQHKRIIQLVDAFAPSPKKRILVMEMIEGGELFERVIDEEFLLTETVCIKFLRQICEAMAYIHKQGIIHMDLKPENILCLSRKGNRIKLIDFGLAKEFSEKNKMKCMAGTAEFVAPEIVNYDPIDYKTDMWSVGVITYILLSGYSPFLGDTDAETYGNVTRGTYDFEPDGFQNISDLGKDFITKLIVYHPLQRMSADDTLKHPWLQTTEEEKRRRRLKHKKKLKRYVVRRRWKKAVHALLALRRMGWDLQQFWTQHRRQ